MNQETWNKIEKEFSKKFGNIIVFKGINTNPLKGTNIFVSDYSQLVKDFFRQKLDQREKEILKELLKFCQRKRTNGSNTTFSDRHLKYHNGLNDALKKVEQKLKELKNE